MNIEVPDPLKQLWSDLAAIGDLFHLFTKTEAGVAVPKEIRERLIESAKMLDPKIWLDIEPAFTSKKTQLRPSSSKVFECHLSIQHSLIFRLMSFLAVCFFLLTLFDCVFATNVATRILFFADASFALKN